MEVSPFPHFVAELQQSGRIGPILLHYRSSRALIATFTAEFGQDFHDGAQHGLAVRGLLPRGKPDLGLGLDESEDAEHLADEAGAGENERGDDVLGGLEIAVHGADEAFQRLHRAGRVEVVAQTGLEIKKSEEERRGRRCGRRRAAR